MKFKEIDPGIPGIEITADLKRFLFGITVLPKHLCYDTYYGYLAVHFGPVCLMKTWKKGKQ